MAVVDEKLWAAIEAASMANWDWEKFKAQALEAWEEVLVEDLQAFRKTRQKETTP